MPRPTAIVIMIYATFINSIIGVGTTNFREVEKKWWAGKKLLYKKEICIKESLT